MDVFGVGFFCGGCCYPIESKFPTGLRRPQLDSVCGIVFLAPWTWWHGCGRALATNRGGRSIFLWCLTAINRYWGILRSRIFGDVLLGIAFYFQYDVRFMA